VRQIAGEGEAGSSSLPPAIIAGASAAAANGLGREVESQWSSSSHQTNRNTLEKIDLELVKKL
jgi:hypothetical protein